MPGATMRLAILFRLLLLRADSAKHLDDGVDVRRDGLHLLVGIERRHHGTCFQNHPYVVLESSECLIYLFELFLVLLRAEDTN